MSEPTLYGRKGGDLEPLKDGQFVTYSDYAALKAENERLRSASFVTAVPAEQYERVIKAGDDLYSLIIVLDYCLGNPEVNNPAKQAWLAAKEGRDAK